MRRVQVVRRAARRPLAEDETVETAAATPESTLRARRATRDAEVVRTLSLIDEVTAG